MTLKEGTSLQDGKYIIKKVLGQGGFGITYLAEQTSLGRKVAIKEFFMKEFCNRDEATSYVSVGSEGCRKMVTKFREKFVKEARNIARLEHTNIISVVDVFEENGTAYYVMKYCDGGSIAQLVKFKYPLGMPESMALKYIREVAAALDYIHQRKMNHLDVKPANIMLNKADSAVLIDFGMSKQYDVETGQETSSTPIGISDGYAPIEQYQKGGVSEFSPSTDIYSLGATFYNLITGKNPPSAVSLNESGLPAFEASAFVAEAITTAMQPKRSDRPQCINDWISKIETHERTRKSIKNRLARFTDEIPQIFSFTKKSKSNAVDAQLLQEEQQTESNELTIVDSDSEVTIREDEIDNGIEIRNATDKDSIKKRIFRSKMFRNLLIIAGTFLFLLLITFLLPKETLYIGNYHCFGEPVFLWVSDFSLLAIALGLIVSFVSFALKKRTNKININIGLQSLLFPVFVSLFLYVAIFFKLLGYWVYWEDANCFIPKYNDEYCIRNRFGQGIIKQKEHTCCIGMVTVDNSLPIIIDSSGLMSGDYFLMKEDISTFKNCSCAYIHLIDRTDMEKKKYLVFYNTHGNDSTKTLKSYITPKFSGAFKPSPSFDDVLTNNVTFLSKEIKEANSDLLQILLQAYTDNKLEDSMLWYLMYIKLYGRDTFQTEIQKYGFEDFWSLESIIDKIQEKTLIDDAKRHYHWTDFKFDKENHTLTVTWLMKDNFVTRQIRVEKRFDFFTSDLKRNIDNSLIKSFFYYIVEDNLDFNFILQAQEDCDTIHIPWSIISNYYNNLKFTATIGETNGHDWVDLGLPSGTKWATMNVGATLPSDYGNYFAWGETSPKDSYDWSNLKHCLDTTGNKFSKYVTGKKFGNRDNKLELDLCDDAAYVNWGSGWRMPSQNQLEELKSECKYTKASMNGKFGYKFTSKTNGNFIFLPFAGSWVGSCSFQVDSLGSYWSREKSSSGSYDDAACNLEFGSVWFSAYIVDRRGGLSVRPVLDN